MAAHLDPPSHVLGPGDSLASSICCHSHSTGHGVRSSIAAQAMVCNCSSEGKKFGGTPEAGEDTGH